jgi:hypothetical protein
MLAAIRRARAAALAAPRVDMPGAQPTPGVCRLMTPMPIPDSLPHLKALIEGDSVRLSWDRRADTIGLHFELHRAPQAGFTPTEKTRLLETAGFRYTDLAAPPGDQQYALVLLSGEGRSAPVRARVSVPAPKPPLPPTGVVANAHPGEIVLSWTMQDGDRALPFRSTQPDGAYEPLVAEPLAAAQYVDAAVRPETTYHYLVRSVSRRGVESAPSFRVSAKALPEARDPVFTVPCSRDLKGTRGDGSAVAGRRHGAARVAQGVLDLRAGGYVTYPHHRDFDLRRKLTIEFWIRLDGGGTMPVVLSCGAFNDRGWFVQRYQGRWRWHVGGVSCDGGGPTLGKWHHIVCSFDGRLARVIQDGKQVASARCSPNPAPWPGPLTLGQYSSPGPSFQPKALMSGLRIYRCVLSAEEIRSHIAEGRPGQ